MRFFLILLSVALASCSRWERRTDAMAAVWLDSTRFAAPTLSSEYKPAGLFSKSEMRRLFSTEIRFFEKKENDASPLENPATLAFKGMLISGPVQIFGGLLYVRRLPDEKSWIHELIFHRPDGKERSLVRSGQRGATIRGLLQSPDRKKVLLVYNINSEQFLLIMLDHLPAEEDPAPTPEFISVGGTPEIAWDKSSARVFVKGSRELIQWNGRHAPTPAQMGPSCFYPPSKSGLNISPEGLEARLDEKTRRWSFHKSVRWAALDSIALVKAKEAGTGCLTP